MAEPVNINTLVFAVLSGFFVSVHLSVLTKKAWVAVLAAMLAAITLVFVVYRNRAYRDPPMSYAIPPASPPAVPGNPPAVRNPPAVPRNPPAVRVTPANKSTESLRDTGRHGVVGDVSCARMNRFAVPDKGIPQPLRARREWLQYLAVDQLHASDPYLTRAPIKSTGS